MSKKTRAWQVLNQFKCTKSRLREIMYMCSVESANHDLNTFCITFVDKKNQLTKHLINLILIELINHTFWTKLKPSLSMILIEI